MRIALATCSAAELFDYVQARGRYVERQELIFAAGSLGNKRLRDDLGCAEQARWDEGRRAADPSYINPYYRS